MPNTFNDEILREFDEKFCVTSAGQDELSENCWSWSIEGQHPENIRVFLLSSLTKAREDEREKIGQWLFENVIKMIHSKEEIDGILERFKSSMFDTPGGIPKTEKCPECQFEVGHSQGCSKFEEPAYIGGVNLKASDIFE